MLTNELYNYHEHYEKVLYKICKVFIEQEVYVVELKHIHGMLLADDGKYLSME